MHSNSTGSSSRLGVNEERLLYSLNTSIVDPNTGNVVCGTDNSGDGIPDSNDCVPVNLFAPSLYEGLLGNDFATQAEREFLFSNRAFDTEYKQDYVNLLITGDLFDLMRRAYPYHRLTHDLYRSVSMA